jgi:hypothetical protein
MPVMSRQCTEIWTSSRARNQESVYIIIFPQLHPNKFLNRYHDVSLCDMCQQTYESWTPCCFYSATIFDLCNEQSFTLSWYFLFQFVMCELHNWRVQMILFPASAVIWVGFVCGLLDYRLVTFTGSCLCLGGRNVRLGAAAQLLQQALRWLHCACELLKSSVSSVKN